MAFTGSATVVNVSDRLARITGVSLAADASGTIGLPGKTVAAEVTVGTPDWLPYSRGSVAVGLQDAVSVLINPVTDVTTPVPISVVKTGGAAGQADFVITLHNDTAATASANLEIYVEYH